VELGLKGANFVIQKINDKIQSDRMMEAWAKLKPEVERHLDEHPEDGALIMVRFGRHQKEGAQHESPLEHTSRFMSIEVAYGPTEDEVWNRYKAQPRLRDDRGIPVSTQRSFIPPRAGVDVKKISTPFRKYGLATFASGKAGLMRVRWNGVLGFDEIDDVRLEVPTGFTPRFLLLLAPSKLTWFNGYETNSELPVAWKNAASAEPQVTRTRAISVVDMDRGVFEIGNDTAAMVFPADNATARLFDSVAITSDTNGAIKTYNNFRMVRWVRPENIHVLRLFLEEKTG
jgi:hypothetical protein